MYSHKPVASFELIACDEAAKMSRQHCQGINGNSVCKFLKFYSQAGLVSKVLRWH